MKKISSNIKIDNWFINKWLGLYYKGVKDNSLFWKLLVIVSAFVASVLMMMPYIDNGIAASDIILSILGSSFSVIILFLPFRSPFRSCRWDWRILFIMVYALMIRQQMYLFSLSIGQDRDNFKSGWIMYWFVVTLELGTVLQLNILLGRLYNKGNKIAVILNEFAFKYSLSTRSKGRNDCRIRLFSIITVSMLFFGIIFIVTSRYLNAQFPNMNFETILFTVRFSQGGFSSEIRDFIIVTLSVIIILTILFSILLFRREKAEKLVMISPDRKSYMEMKITKTSKWTSFILPAALFVYGALTLSSSVDLIGFIKQNLDSTNLYEEYYVKPTNDIIHFPDKKKNLVYIYLESYENTFTSYENGGNQPNDYMPEIYELEKNNINFSNCSGVGGQSVYFPMIRYTMGSAVAQTSGVPLTSVLNIDRNIVADEVSSLFGSLIRLEDILHDAGYNQMYVNGNDTKFAGYNRYVGRYDDSNIYDYVNAKADGRIPEGYHYPWGIEDSMVFDIVKDKIEELAVEEAPFYIATFTIDTHSAEGGFRCKFCDPDIKNDFAAAISCSSRQIRDFIEWLSEKPYWKDTVVIFVGDHPAEHLVDGIRFDEDNYIRTTCNCIINSTKTPVNEKNRIFCAMDMFPTTLSAIGCDIDGDRLGLGTDLFSDTPTLCEELGEDKFAEEVQKKSEYYINNFLASEK